jgi:hypothetical protein
MEGNCQFHLDQVLLIKKLFYLFIKTKGKNVYSKYMCCVYVRRKKKEKKKGGIIQDAIHNMYIYKKRDYLSA